MTKSLQAPDEAKPHEGLGKRLLRAGDRIFCKILFSGKYLGEGIVTRNQRHPSDPVTFCRLDALMENSRICTTRKEHVELMSDQFELEEIPKQPR